MTINSYLTGIANNAILRDQVKLGIQRSVATLNTRLQEYFGAEISRSLVFGSHSRGTILPPRLDPYADVDLMVVFADGSYRPQTYLDRLRRFTEYRYSRSEIAQSSPTIVLSLNHIRFELVPATESWLSGLQIPAPASDSRDWIETDPTGFNEKLTKTNQSHGNLIKPLIRVMKYWNAKAGYPYESYGLEQAVVDNGFLFLGLLSSGQQIKDYFFAFIEDLNAGWGEPQSKQNAVNRLKQIAAQAKALEAGGNVAAAESVIARALPPLGLLA
ncbi:MAG: hypothetical protein U0997_07105 [Sulfurimicrobium sp.]|nr:hypothetical protein [Sulfurimicrobium sp.]